MDIHAVSYANPFQKTTLPNGLRVTTCEMPLTRSVSVNVYVGVGSRYESDERAGVSHFIEHMLFKGTERRPTPVEISSTIEGTGGMINAGTEHELTVYWCKVAQPHFEESLDVLMDILRNSLFESESIEKERQVVFEELNMINDYPTYRADSLIDEMMWPEHALGREIGGTKQSVGEITREMMLEHLGEYYTPGNVVVSVAGNVRHEDVVRQVGELSADWPTAQARGWSPVTHTQQAPQVRLEYRRTEQTHLCIGLPGFSIVDPDRYALDVLSIILGEGMSSRLFVEVREKGGLAYDVHSGVSHFLDCGAFVVTAGVDPSRVYEAVELILAEVGGLRDSVTEDELGAGQAVDFRPPHAAHGGHAGRGQLDRQPGAAPGANPGRGRRGGASERRYPGRPEPREQPGSGHRQAEHGRRGFLPGRTPARTAATPLGGAALSPPSPYRVRGRL